MSVKIEFYKKLYHFVYGIVGYFCQILAEVIIESRMVTYFFFKRFQIYLCRFGNESVKIFYFSVFFIDNILKLISLVKSLISLVRYCFKLILTIFCMFL